MRTHLELKHARDTLVRYGQELRRLNDEKDEFMDIAAHDLRNPLGAIIGYAEMFLEESATLQPSPTDRFDQSRREMTECARRIEATSRRVAEIEAMDGRVWCESEPGHGARFIVELPTA